MATAEELLKQIEQSQEGDWTCVLCGMLTRQRGLLIPKDPSEFGMVSPKNKTRCIVYALCEHCSGRPDALVRVEEILKKQGGQMAASMPEYLEYLKHSKWLEKQ